MSELSQRLENGFLDAEDQAEEVFEEDPILHDGKGKPAWTETEFVEYFAERDFPGSPCEGYHMLADYFISDLHQVLRHLEKVNNQDASDTPPTRLVIPVALKPFNAQTEDKAEAARLYSREETKASHAFRGQMEYMLRARIINSDADWGSTQTTLYSAKPYNPYRRNTDSIYLLENRGRDKKGDYTQLWLSSHVTSTMLQQPSFQVDESKSFFTTGETESMVLDLYEDLGRWAIRKAA